MSIASDKFMEHIQEGTCPICIKQLPKETKIIDDPRFGKVSICGHHTVHIKDKVG